MKSLSNFPHNAGAKVFDPGLYGIDPRQQVANQSPYSGEIGIEIEVEGERLPASNCPAIGRTQWIYKHDGSLRAVGGGAPGGAEYVLAEPVDQPDVPVALGNLFRHFRDNGARIVNSTRCSTHVHLNMQQMKLNQVASFVILWATFEDALSLWCGDHRAGNHFALRLSDCDDAVDRWLRAFKTGCFEWSYDRRYLALNPASLATFGSLEVRMMGGADNERDVVKWVDWLQRIKRAATSPRFENPESIAGAFSGCMGLDFARQILGEEATEELARICDASGESFSSLMRKGFRRIQQLCWALPWAAVVAECRKPFVPNPFYTGGPRKKRERGLEGLEIRLNIDEEMPDMEDDLDD